MKILVIIPARGGSKGIPKKNIRSLVGRPLISYGIKTALNSKYHPDVYVSTEDPEIMFVAQTEGANIHKRSPDLAQDQSTLDEVIVQAYREIQASTSVEYDLVVSLQATCPLLSTESLDKGISQFINSSNIDTLLTAREERHLTWKKDKDQFVPGYKERKNRQYLEPYWVETGGFVVCRPDFLIKNQTRFGPRISLYTLTAQEALDIDDYADWSACEFYLKRKKILFFPIGYEEVGLGHVYRTLTLATGIQNHDVEFIVSEKSLLAAEIIRQHNFKVTVSTKENELDVIQSLHPDLIVNDRLDTDESYVMFLKQSGLKVVNFEDLGEGALHADKVVNALYSPDGNEPANFHYGENYFCAREEFIICPPHRAQSKPTKILITFGGTDPSHLTEKAIEALSTWSEDNNIEVKLVLGLGVKREIPETRGNWVVERNIRNMAHEMHKADIVITSAGRTVYEAACIGTPTIVIAQNQRETKHPFPREENGFLYLGLGERVSSEVLLNSVQSLWSNLELREKMSQKMLSHNLKHNRRRVVRIIEDLLEEK